MFSHPKDRLGIITMPGTTLGNLEEWFRTFAVFLRHQDANLVGYRDGLGKILLPQYREKERSSTIHDGDVWHGPIPIIALQIFDDSLEECMTWYAAHSIIANSCRDGHAYPGWVLEQRIQASGASIVQVEVDSAVVG